MNYEKVILIAIDTLRADHLGCYGYDFPTSPFIDELAEEGGKFSRCFASDVPTPPSFSALLTGTRGIHNGITGFNNGPEDFRPGTRPLPELLREAGYRTGAFSNLLYPSPWLVRGFQDIYPPGNRFQGGTAEEVTGEGLSWLENHGREDFFLFLHYWDPHCPYRERSREKYRKLFSPADYEGLIPDMKYVEEDEFLRIFYDRKHETMEDPLEASENMALYDANIRYVDDQIERLFSGLKELGLAEDTLVVLTSDHGEAFGEYGFWDHWSSYKNVSHVPLVFWGEGIKSGNITDLVQGIDVAPTILELTGTSLPEGLDGNSLVPAMGGSDEAGRGWAVVNSDSTVIQRMYVEGQEALVFTLTNSGWDHIDSYELFDLDEDPDQVEDLSGKREGRAKELRIKLANWEAKALGNRPDPLRKSVEIGGWMWPGLLRLLDAEERERFIKRYPELKPAAARLLERS